MKLEAARRSMTTRELMTHSSGLGYVLNQANAVDRLIIKEQILNSAVPLQTMIDKLAKTPLSAQPGTRWYYSIAIGTGTISRNLVYQALLNRADLAASVPRLRTIRPSLRKNSRSCAASRRPSWRPGRSFRAHGSESTTACHRRRHF